MDPEDAEEAEAELNEIYEQRKNYMPVIKSPEPSPPPVKYGITCSVTSELYEKPLEELYKDGDEIEAPEYQAQPVRSLINSYEQGLFAKRFCCSR